jgi:putative endopeptidase
MSLRRLAFAVPFALAAAALAIAAPAVEHGVQRANMDTSVRPGDDFNAYANGAWMKRVAIPADQASWGAFSILRDNALKRTADLITDLGKKTPKPGTDEARIAAYYATYLDERAIEAKGLAPLKDDIARIAAINDRASLARALGETIRLDVDALNNTSFATENLFGLWVAPGFNDSDHYNAYLLQGGLGMPERRYYEDDASKASYRAHVLKILTLAASSTRRRWPTPSSISKPASPPRTRPAPKASTC